MKEDPSPEPRARVVLLGASNLFLGLPHALRHAVGRLPGRDLSFYVAHGPGRSYGIEAGLLGVRFTGIQWSGILEALEGSREARGFTPTWSLLTDVGNDILYQSGVERILSWVEEITSRLLALGSRVAITSLPLQSVEDLPALRFRLLRPLYYPTRPMTQEKVLAQMRPIQEGLSELGQRRGARILPTRSSWYGFDHFHLRVRSRREAFSYWLDELLFDGENTSRGEPCLGRLQTSSIRLRFHRPAEYLFLASRRRHLQKGLPIAPGARLYAF